jgi:hypothetical protein
VTDRTCDNTRMLESPTVGAEPAVTAQDRAALLEVENGELRVRIEARDQRIRLLEEALLPFSSLSGKANL